METIQATVNMRLLNKASRLFTGQLDGRIIEVLQNARRAGATRVEITNAEGQVTVRDNGHGIEDFSKVLDMGGLGWDEALEVSEDPAGVGLFCLAPREVTIRSNGKRVTIGGDGWTGAPVNVTDDEPVPGTVLEFHDEDWSSSAVMINAVFSGMQVTVDGSDCPILPFLSDKAAHYPELGCRIEVRQEQDLNPWHHSCKRERWAYNNSLVNFHGQVVAFDCHPVKEHHLHFLVDMTGEPTGIRLMLPARTCLVENEELDRLRAAMELEAYRYLQQREKHRLPYEQYLRAGSLGIVLPEAEPAYRVGTLTGDAPEPIPVPMPDDFPLTRCYRLDPDFPGQQTDGANIHLLGALGRFDVPFVPVEISKAYDGYSWANLPRIGKVELEVGKVLQESWMWCGKLVCVDSLRIAAHTSDGRVFRSPVCMAMKVMNWEKDRPWGDEEVLVTPEARERLGTTDILYHLGGYSDEGDTWDTQEASFAEELDRFWSQLVGPDENFRRTVLSTLDGQRDWKAMTVFADGRIKLRFKDGSAKHIRPPKPAKTAR